VEQRIRFRGWLGAHELAQEFADASIVALPSLWPEPFGIVGIEGFAAGRPAVASMTGGITDWLEPGVSGLGVPAGKVGELAGALAGLLEDPARQREMGLAGRDSLRGRFSLERHVGAICEAYGAARVAWELARGASPRASVRSAA
jgi:glycosyltransferase involved in cell wall biosynthesis